MVTALILLIVLMILGAVAALESRDLLSGIISLGIIGFALTVVFLLLQAPDLAIVQIIVETMTLVILIAAVMKTSRADAAEQTGKQNVLIGLAGIVFAGVFLAAAWRAFQHMPDFGALGLRMAREYVTNGLAGTGAANLVAAVILDYRAYDTLGEATVLFTSVVGVTTVLRTYGRNRA